MAPVPEGILQLLRALPGWSGQVSAPSLPPAPCAAAARPPGPVSHCCSGCLCLFPVLQLCSLGLCSVLLLEVPLAAPARGNRRFPGHPSLLCSPGSASVPRFSSTRGCSLQQLILHNSHGHIFCPGGISGTKQTPPSTSVTARGGSTAATALLFNFLFPNQKWPKKRDGEFST